ncbi:lasso peptide biosynthesis protein [Paenibacillus sp. TC-CSREp1]|uniref:lasso peptide biosynthesis protein n=1 Tax=Paenibacillus sp. TC-CSREp1 TaxID=3410089 RepID=UPI003CF26550
MKNDFKKLSYMIMKKSEPNYMLILKKNISIIFSLFVYLRILKMYKMKGLNSTLQLNKSINKNINKTKKMKGEISNDTLLNFSMMLVLFYRFFGRLYGETGNCLERSVPLYSALLYLGFEPKLVIAKPKKRGSLTFMFHAWVEVSSKPVNDFADIRDHYYVLYNY